jgi:hypothetical protein
MGPTRVRKGPAGPPAQSARRRDTHSTEVYQEAPAQTQSCNADEHYILLCVKAACVQVCLVAEPSRERLSRLKFPSCSLFQV